MSNTLFATCSPGIFGFLIIKIFMYINIYIIYICLYILNVARNFHRIGLKMRKKILKNSKISFAILQLPSSWRKSEKAPETRGYWRGGREGNLIIYFYLFAA